MSYYEPSRALTNMEIAGHMSSNHETYPSNLSIANFNNMVRKEYKKDKDLTLSAAVTLVQAKMRSKALRDMTS
tara:strand:+ start:88 stop:306 length:219 start_codon:yes stop_codon:yes gene_type:complete